MAPPVFTSAKQKRLYEAYLALQSVPQAAKASGYHETAARARIAAWRKAGHIAEPGILPAAVSAALCGEQPADGNGNAPPLAEMDRRARILLLSQFAQAANLSPETRLKAVDLLNKLTGEYKEPPRQGFARLQLDIGRTVPTPGQRALAAAAESDDDEL